MIATQWLSKFVLAFSLDEEQKVNDFESLVGKTIKVVSMGEATEQDRRYEGHIGKVLRVTQSPWGFRWGHLGDLR